MLSRLNRLGMAEIDYTKKRELILIMGEYYFLGQRVGVGCSLRVSNCVRPWDDGDTCSMSSLSTSCEQR